MNSKYKVAVLISSLLLILSVVVSSVNYFVSFQNAEKQLKNQSLPLSLDNIYTEIQKEIIEPYLVSSMMANDTFLQEWLSKNEDDKEKITNYLEAIKNKYEMFSTFLVSDKTKNYYTHDGFIETISKENSHNTWYFDFRNLQESHEINLDFNKNLSNTLMMFINYKIFDKNYHFLGATGVAIKISYIDEMLKKFRLKHHFKVLFLNNKGKVVLGEKEYLESNYLKEIPSLGLYEDKIISKTSNLIEYKLDGEDYIVNTKYIPELDLYLVVEAELNTYVQDIKQVFYINIIFSLFATLIVTLLVIFIIYKYNKRLEHLSEYDLLTNIFNRRKFEELLNHQVLIYKRNKQPLSLIFLDIDNFKNINDTFGHQIGDEVLVKIAQIINQRVRKTDFIGRWGGEEFIIALIDSNEDGAETIANDINNALKNDLDLKRILNQTVTASFGISKFKDEDSINTITSRIDKAMYRSKKEGKNRVTIL